MKTLFSFLAILGTIILSGCSRVPENNDPVIGIWSKVDATQLQDSKKISIRQEWIFNDAYLGRYHSYENKELEVKTDFKWTKNKDIYTISYPGTDIPEHHVTLQEMEETVILKEISGAVFAERE